jgi:hypothetical protein
MMPDSGTGALGVSSHRDGCGQVVAGDLDRPGEPVAVVEIEQRRQLFVAEVGVQAVESAEPGLC